MRFSKVRDVKTPLRANTTDAGIDFFVPNDSTKFYNDVLSKNSESIFSYIFDEGIRLHPHERILIPSGIHVEVPKGYALIAFNKSGVASKKGLDLLASVVDEEYQGEVHISVQNTSNENVFIEFGSKIIQFILLPVNYSMPEEVPFEDLYKEESLRGAGGFGSTGV